jgi:hypothetical protein
MQVLPSSLQRRMAFHTILRRRLRMWKTKDGFVAAQQDEQPKDVNGIKWLKIMFLTP